MSEYRAIAEQPSRVALVTGATGFVGSHLVRRLVQDGWQVHIVIRPASVLPQDPEFMRISAHVHDGTTDGMIHIVGESKPDVVFHLSSLFLAQHQSRDVESLITSNILFSTQLLEAMSAQGIRSLVNTGTSWQHYNNEDYNPVCLYAATKQAFETILTYYTEAAGLRAATLQLYDTYGPDDRRRKLFALLRDAAETRTPLLMSPGDQLIDLVYIDDVIEAYARAAAILQGGEIEGHRVYAVSSGASLKLKDLVGVYSQLCGRQVPVEWGARSYRTREVMVPWNRGHALPGWQPRVGLEEGICKMEQSVIGAPE